MSDPTNNLPPGVEAHRLPGNEPPKGPRRVGSTASEQEDYYRETDPRTSGCLCDGCRGGRRDDA